MMRSNLNLKISEDAKFYHLNFYWSGNSLQISREGDIVEIMEGIVHISEEYRYLAELQEDLLFLKILCTFEKKRAFFINHDKVQTTVREVDPDLDDLDCVLRWLLPPDYTYRQGDIGIYHRSEIFDYVKPVQETDYAQYFSGVLGRRHVLDPMTNCIFFAGKGSCWIHVNEPVQLVHPEHKSIEIEAGLYEIQGARGEILPKSAKIRVGKPLLWQF
jgi:hypothetical protein